ncbi:hypothetical protein VHEMI02298 [[Torrubiella] hemipterigena]|uniref:Tyrosine specific protein phosphatases domain-containing protein n=1 Tax=[Torrubiella] hemipterigena TaxID=1531966 RepID=A0A0A1SVF9_9HYPO|nr:hypothetical protein VHEMI02298 [[Torrubiella] hemipterigena]
MAARESTPIAPYTLGSPSAPLIAIPVAGGRQPTKDGDIALKSTLDLSPSSLQAAVCGLSSDELAVVMPKESATASTDRSESWAYEMRWQAQPILDFLYLGPTAAVKDVDFMRNSQITLLVIIRDSRMRNTKAQVAERISSELGFQIRYAYVDGTQALIHDIPSLIEDINRHILSVYNSTNGSCRGKVLITCETGNGRSAAVAAAYLMQLYGRDVVTVVQFMILQRFCVNFDEDIKQMLTTWAGLLKAKASGLSHDLPNRAKRRRDDDVIDQEMEEDGQRFTGRENFAPFIDNEI